MAESDKVPQINPAEIEILIEKIEQNKLDERERRLIVALLRTFLYVVAQLQEKKITLLKLKDMIFGPKSEKSKREKEKAGEGEKETAEGGPEGGRGTKNRKMMALYLRQINEATDEILFRPTPARRKCDAGIVN